MSVEYVQHPALLLKEVHTLSFSQHLYQAQNGHESSIHYETGFGIYWDPDQNVIAVRTKLTAFADKDDSENGVVLATLESLVLFDVVSQEGEDPTWQIAEVFVANIIGIAYSTSRGILIGRSQLDLFATQPPPAISPTAVVQDMQLEWVKAG